MATFSFGTVPGAPGTYINERAGNIATAAIASFNTTYMLVEAEENVPVARFPFNTPIPVASLEDYVTLVGSIPTGRIPLLSYNCVNSFFSNAQVGDLRVVRVGTPDQIVEIEILPSGQKVSSTGLPSPLQAGDTVYAQVTLNNLKLVSGDGSAGFTSTGEWLGVPVTIPVDYISGDAVNNRKISQAITTAIRAAIESNPSVQSSVYVRDSGLVNTLDPTSNSENGFITLAATAYNGSVSVLTLQNPVGSNSVFMQNTYVVNTYVGLETNLERVPQDYIQCINTALDGQKAQGYLITPTAYAQFDAEGRASIGAAAAALCQGNDFKWKALADAGPFNVTDINKFKNYIPHQAAANLTTGQQYLVDNAIYKWVGSGVSYDRLRHQDLVPSYDPEVAVRLSQSEIADNEKVGALDLSKFILNSTVGLAETGVFTIDSNDIWPVEYQIQEVTLSDEGADFSSWPSNVYIVAPPFNTALYGKYPSDGTNQYVFVALTANEAVSVLTEVTALGGTSAVIGGSTPTGAQDITIPTGSTVSATYETPQWNFPITINSQTSNLIQNTTGDVAYVNTLHLPGTLQDPTEEYRLAFVSRTVSDSASSFSDSSGNLSVSCVSHGLVDGQKLFFTRAVTANSGSTVVIKATTRNSIQTYFVKVVDNDNFLLSTTYSNFLGNSFVPFPTGTLDSTPTIFYSSVRGGGTTAINLSELSTISLIRGRKYGFATGTIANEAATSTSLTPSANNPRVSVYLNTSSSVLGRERVFPYGETAEANWLPSLDLQNPGVSVQTTDNFLCTPTVNQSFSTEAFLVPSIESINGGNYNPALVATRGPISSVGTIVAGTGGASATYSNVSLTGGTGFAAKATVVVSSGGVTSVTITSPGYGYTQADTLSAAPGSIGGTTGFSVPVSTISVSNGVVTATTPFVNSLKINNNYSGGWVQSQLSNLGGVHFVVLANGTAPDGTTVVVAGDRIAVVFNGSSYDWVVVPADSQGGDMSSVAQVCYGTQIEMALSQERTLPKNLWRFDVITPTEIIDEALRGVGFSGEPQAEFVEAGVDNVNRLYDDSQLYFNPFGFISYYGPYVESSSGAFIPPTPYVTGVALRRYRSEGFQFPPAGVKYQLSDAVGVQISVNSAQQNLLNPDGCNVVRSLPGYPNTAIYIWGGRTRINKSDPQQRKFQFVNTRVIQNVVFGSLKNAFDNQIFSVSDSFGFVFNQIVSIGNSVLNQLYTAGALFGARPSDAYQVICDDRINSPENLEDGIVYVRVFDVPVPALERIEIDQIRVSIGQMNAELTSQGLG